MARPRAFDEQTVLDAAVECFWDRGYQATSLRELMDSTGLTSASLYNAFSDKRALFQSALDHFVAHTIDERIHRLGAVAPREAIEHFFEEVITRSLNDRRHKGCMLVNSAIEVAPHDAGLQREVSTALRRIEMFFVTRVRAGQLDRTISAASSAEDLGGHLLGVLIGLRVLARVRPEENLLRAVVSPALALLDPEPSLKCDPAKSSHLEEQDH